jgi:hypothetical protein
MTPQDASADADADASPEAPPSLVEAQLHLLGQLAEAGLRIAEALKREATGEAPRTMPLSAIALAFSRVSRAVRLSVMLSAKLSADAVRARAEAAPHPQAALTDEAPSLQDIEASSDSETVAAADDAAERADLAEESEQESADTAERAEREGAERLDRPDREDFRHLLVLPPAEVIDIIRRDLGLPPDWPAQNSALPYSPPLRSGGGGAAQRALGHAPSVLLRTTQGAFTGGPSAPSTAARSPSPAGGGGEGRPLPMKPSKRWCRPPDG